jgi:hypothetical protein
LGGTPANAQHVAHSDQHAGKFNPQVKFRSALFQIRHARRIQISTPAELAACLSELFSDFVHNGTVMDTIGG